MLVNENGDQPVKICPYHGPLFMADLIKSGTGRQGEQRYKCRKCMKVWHANHFEKNKDKLRDKQREYKKNNWEIVKKKKAEYSKKYHADPDKKPIINARNKRYRDKNAERLNAGHSIRKKRYTETLHDTVVKRSIIEDKHYKKNYRGILKAKDIPQELVDVKRELMKINRLIREKLYEQQNNEHETNT